MLRWRRRRILLRKSIAPPSSALATARQQVLRRGRPARLRCCAVHRHRHHVRITESRELQLASIRPIAFSEDESLVHRPLDVAQHPLDCHPVILPRIFHEPAHIPDRERDVRPSMGELAQPADNAPVVRRVHLLRRALLRQLDPLFHRGRRRLAVGHAGPL